MKISFHLPQVAQNTPNSDVIELDWLQPDAPIFTQGPQDSTGSTNVNILAGQQFILYSNAIGLPTPAYKWRVDGANITGATSASYTNSNPQPLSTNSPTTYLYSVVATNLGGSITSEVASVSVYPSLVATLKDLTNKLTSMEFQITGATNYSYRVEFTTNLTDWVPVRTNTASYFFTNYVDTNELFRFFRSIPQ